MTHLCERLSTAVGFRVHAHAFRHTFATVCCQQDWSLDRLRAALGHADLEMTHLYTQLAAEVSLGPREVWREFVFDPTGVDFMR